MHHEMHVSLLLSVHIIPTPSIFDYEENGRESHGNPKENCQLLFQCTHVDLLKGAKAAEGRDLDQELSGGAVSVSQRSLQNPSNPYLGIP